MQLSNKRSDKKTIFGWVMYDFANSSFTTLIVTFIYATYFTKEIADDVISGTASWGRAVAVTALIVALLSPILGIIADQRNKRKQFLIFFTTIAVLSSAMLYTVLPGEVMTALTWFVIGNVAYELGGVFYNAFLPEISPPDKIGRISGLGWGVGYFGGLAAMFIAMVGFINPEIPWFGLSKEAGGPKRQYFFLKKRKTQKTRFALLVVRI
jgi:UMF1 family MFS transporter